MFKLFNLSLEEANLARKRSVCCLVIYDIVSNKRRLKLSKILAGYGERIQKSCYEMNLEEAVYKSLIDDIDLFYRKNDNDNIIIYRAIDGEVVRYNEYVPEFSQEYFLFL
ncbi:CRISPR-associated endonuclease Cas2 [Aerococcaceae bacterium WS4759]|uniref:CRISPR-associated endoribonuclease Cas2 n=1 Tax=Fundicoccus ignavus TaxID=2664442 RepID=A0A6I2GI22_9LACT|nr:CRISPR-associated endonuclease Cas2 [Fundicoccus ignavus]MRI86364.1 CRISPR-associated endonuclease Cas2 [Fundicoccus ignavus]